jgi:endoglycosylceramidase
LIFFEPGTTDFFGAGFKDTPGGVEYRDREVYSYHIYCLNVDYYSVPKNE